MPKAILAIRSYPATLLLALFLFIATLVVTTGSLGKVGAGGGDDGDGGSGIGGTGKSGEFGGSGFGGTGGPSPFFTSTDTEDRQSEPAVLDIAEPTPQGTTELAATESQDSAISQSADSLSSVIEEVIEQHPLVNESEIILAADTDDVMDTRVETQAAQPVPSPALQVVEAVQVERAEINEPDKVPETAPVSVEESPYSAVVENSVEAEPVRAEDDLQHVAETMPVNLENDPESIDQEIDRRSLPERIQRPELPPFQRIRPVERAAIMPPRVQPMRI